MEKYLKKMKRVSIYGLFLSMLLPIACVIKIYVIIKLLPKSNLSFWEIIEYGTSLESSLIATHYRIVDIIILSNIYQGVICIILFEGIILLIACNLRWVKKVRNMSKTVSDNQVSDQTSLGTPTDINDNE